MDLEHPELGVLITEVAEAARLKEGPPGVETVLRTLYQTEPTGLKPLSRQVRLPVPVLAAVLGELDKRGMIQRGDGVRLTERGREFVQAEMGVFTRALGLCNGCNGRTITIPARLRPVVEKLSSYTQRSPGVDTALDQAPSTPESAIRRALFMIQHGAVEGRRLFILGDDDSISLAVGLLGQALHPGDSFVKRLVVIESDTRWVDFLRAAAREEDLNIEVIEADLRDPLPEGLRGAFDSFETDPPYTLQGMSLFVSRGVEALHEKGGGQGFLSLGAAPPENMLSYQNALSSMGLVTAELLPNFNVYQGASLLGGTSHLYHLEATEGAYPLISGVYRDEEIYTGGQNPVLRVYRCMSCGRSYKVGLGQSYPGIEKLKAAGCEACGEKRFELTARILRE